MVEPAVPMLLEQIQYAEYPIDTHAARAFAGIKPVGTNAVEFLTKMLKDDRNRLNAARALGGIGPGAKESVPVLRMMLTDMEVSIGIEAALALWRIEPTESAILFLIQALKDDSPENRRDAAIALGEIGAAAKTAVPSLIDLLSDKKLAHGEPFGFFEEVRTHAALSLGSIGPDAKAAIPKLAELLGDRKLRPTAVIALGMIGPQAKGEIGKINPLLRDPDPHVRHYAAAALRQICR